MEPTYADTTLRRYARSLVECTWVVELRSAERRGRRQQARGSRFGNREAIVRIMREDDVFVKLWLKLIILQGFVLA
jgi:hypothetical protein